MLGVENKLLGLKPERLKCHPGKMLDKMVDFFYK